MNPQVIGLLIGSVGGWLLWSPWSFVIAGAVLILLPELLDAVKR